LVASVIIFKVGDNLVVNTVTKNITETQHSV